MKVKELIEKLKELDGERRITFNDAEYGYWDIDEVIEEVEIEYTEGGYNECGNQVFKWHLFDYDLAEERGYKILNKEDIYVLQ